MAHFLGTVVAYEALHAHPGLHVYLQVTLGVTAGSAPAQARRLPEAGERAEPHRGAVQLAWHHVAGAVRVGVAMSAERERVAGFGRLKDGLLQADADAELGRALPRPCCRWTPCAAPLASGRRAVPPRRDCRHRSVADRRNSSGRTSSPQRCMSSGPSGTPVSFGT